MVQQAVNHGVTNQVITAIVDKNGDITFKGKLAKNAINPIVKIELKDNKMVMLSKMQVISKMC